MDRILATHTGSLIRPRELHVLPSDHAGQPAGALTMRSCSQEEESS